MCLIDIVVDTCLLTVFHNPNFLFQTGMIASYYYIKYNTIELFASTVTPNTKTRGLLEVLSAAVEYNDVPVRLGDDDALRKIGAHVPINLGTSAEPVR